MDIKSIFLSDDALALIDEGRWMEAGDKAPGVEFYVVGLQSEEARKAMREKEAALRKSQGGEPLAEEQYSGITREVLSEVVLKDWRGLEEGGKELPYSAELARKFIMSRGGDQFTTLVLRAAQKLDSQANDFVVGVAKN